MKVKDLPQEAVLLQDSQEVRAVLEGLGLEELYPEYPSLFVEVGEGEYRAVYGLRRFVPYLEEPVEVLYRA
ncbi:hypothetical protein [Thermus sp.]|jgi:hypothetical protein|uniref:DUF6839 family protein n=1 Tax=Thermus sp. TaxID=275 RepID=UPI003D0E89E0